MTTRRALLLALGVVVVLAAVLTGVYLLNSESDPYETAWDNCIQTATDNPPAADEFQIPPDELCTIHENDVGREQFILDFNKEG